MKKLDCLTAIERLSEFKGSQSDDAVSAQIDHIIDIIKHINDDGIDKANSLKIFLNKAGKPSMLDNVNSELQFIIKELQGIEKNDKYTYKRESKSKQTGKNDGLRKKVLLLIFAGLSGVLFIVGLIFAFLDNDNLKWIAFFTPTGTLGAMLQLILGLREWLSDIKSETVPKKQKTKKIGAWVGFWIIVAILLAGAVVAMYFSCLGGLWHTSPLAEKEVNHHVATCDEDEYYEMTCLNCNKVWNKYIKGTAKGHTKDSGKIVKKATCTLEGKRTYKCITCGKLLREETIPAKGHAEDLGETTKEATCALDGEKVFKCTVCHEQVRKEVIPAKGHTEDNGEITKVQSCSGEGERTYKCTDCGSVLRTEPIEKLPHKYAVYESYWNEDGYKEPTSISVAAIPCYCGVCGHKDAFYWNDKQFESEQDAKIRLADKYVANTVVMFDEAKGLLVINLSKQTNALSGLLPYSSIYNTTTKVLTLPNSYGNIGNSVNQVEILGSTAALSEFSITTDSFNTLKLTLQNISFTAKNGIGLDLSKVSNAELTIVGSVTVKGANGKAGISARSLSVHGDSNLTVEGGRGEPGVYGGERNGKIGGIGINATRLAISVSGTVNIYGGVGGDADDRFPGKDANGKYDGNNGDGTNGEDGYKGGTGGTAIHADKVVITKGIVSAKGGDGGCGGDAGECNYKWEFDKHVKGGTGGAGGNGAVAIDVKAIEITGGELYATGGDGGDSGKRGGCHNNEHGTGKFEAGSASDGDYGAAGEGGLGVSSGCDISGDKLQVFNTAGQKGTVNEELNQC